MTLGHFPERARERRGLFGASLVTGTLLARRALFGDTHGLLHPDKVHMLVDGSHLHRGESLVTADHRVRFVRA